MRWLILIAGWTWTRGLWGCSELGLEVRDRCLHPAPAPQPESGAAKYGEENGFIVGCQLPATSHRHRGGYPGAEQGSGALSTARWWDVSLFMQQVPLGGWGWRWGRCHRYLSMVREQSTWI